MSKQHDPVVLHAQAKERLAAIHDEWVRLECPLLAVGSTGQTTEHPLVKMLREHEAHCDRLAKALAPALRGRPPGAASAPDRAGEPPRVKLKAV